MVKLKGLGRGLDALLGAVEPEGESALRNLSVGELRPGKYQPRSLMNDAALQALADSIRAQGIMQPILVRPLDDGGFEIIAGERRWRAAQLAGLLDVPVMVREVADEAALAMALIENIQREDLNPMEQAVGIQRLIDEFEMTHQAAAEAVGYSRSAVSNLLRLRNLPDHVQQLLMENRIDMGHGRALLGLATPARQVELAQVVVQKKLSVRETEKLVNQELKTGEEKKPAPKKDQDVLRLQEEVSQSLGTSVEIRAGKGGRGKIVIDYMNLGHLDEILGKIGGKDRQTS